MKLLCLYKQFIDCKLPNNIHSIITDMDINQHPRTEGYKSTIRYELPQYLETAPADIINDAPNRSYISFKWMTKKYLIDRYASLCTSVGCRACHLSYNTN